MGILKKVLESIVFAIMILLAISATVFIAGLAMSQGALAFLIIIVAIIACIVYMIID